MKLFSSEIRWFSRQMDPLKDIYNSIPGLSESEGIRIDYYLQTDNKDLGVKLRGSGDRVELKWLLDRIHTFNIDANTSLGVENWVKYSLDKNEPIVENLKGLSTSKFEWIKVEKRRIKKKYEILPGEDEKVNPLIGDSFVEDGCNIEFTEIIIDKEKYYSLGFESFFTKERCVPNLMSTLEYCKPYLHVKKMESIPIMGYPQFLMSR